jgi:hypothetical protein
MSIRDGGHYNSNMECNSLFLLPKSRHGPVLPFFITVRTMRVFQLHTGIQDTPNALRVSLSDGGEKVIGRV